MFDAEIHGSGKVENKKNREFEKQKTEFSIFETWKMQTF